ncbi:MAG: T9SS type A sorting domain-containing protein [Ignavibacteria bacterium]|nr:T9SS type A sorting domain-containing protein [Ignavibacteria bacterium]
MKLLIDVKVFCMTSLVVLILTTVSVYTQWSSDFRMTNNPGISNISLNNSRCISVSGQFVHTVWMDDRDNNFEIYYKRSSDGGLNWEPVQRLTVDAAMSELPSIATNGSIIHVVWSDSRNGNSEIYYKRSTNSGTTWQADERITNDPSVSITPVIGINGSIIHIIWSDMRDGNFEIYHKRSTDSGINWDAVMRLTNNSASSTVPSVWASGIYVNIAWEDNRDGNNEIYYNRSTNAGISFGSDIRITNNSSNSLSPSISSSGSDVHIAFFDDRESNYEIFYKHSPDNGINWDAVKRITNAPSASGRPNIVANGANIHIVWDDERDGNKEIYYNMSVNNGNTWNSELRLTNNSSTSGNPFTAILLNTVHVLWQDYRDGNFEIYYKRNPTGNPTGITNLNCQIPDKISLSQNYPNPFNPATNIEFSVPVSGLVKVSVYDVIGREIAAIVNSNLNPGTYKADWDASKFNSGVYFYTLTSGSFTETKKMIFIK